MTIFQLECFLALADSLNFTQTANALYITQPALSRAISSLEQELQLTLLQRTTHTVSLTPAGKAFAGECEALLKGFHRGVERARSAQNGSIGSIRVGFQRDAFEAFIADFFNEFQRLHPDISLEMLPFSPSELLHALNDREADAVIAGGFPLGHSARRLLLKSRQECAVLPPWHPLAHRRSIRMEELRNENFIVMSRTASCSGYDSVIQKALDAGFEAQIVAQVDLVPALMMLVACGRGVSVLHSDLAASCNGRIAFVPLVLPSTFDRWLMWNEPGENPCLGPLIQLGRKWEQENQRERQELISSVLQPEPQSSPE